MRHLTDKPEAPGDAMAVLCPAPFAADCLDGLQQRAKVWFPSAWFRQPAQQGGWGKPHCQSDTWPLQTSAWSWRAPSATPVSAGTPAGHQRIQSAGYRSEQMDDATIAAINAMMCDPLRLWHDR